MRYHFSLANAVQLLRDGGILRQREHDDDDEEAEAAAEEGGGSEEEEDEDDEDDEEGAIIPMPGQDLVCVGAMAVGTGASGFQDGAAAAARFSGVRGMLQMPDGRLLVADQENNRIRMLSADLQQASTVAGDGEVGHEDGAAAQALFNRPHSFALLPDGRVLVADFGNNCIRMLSTDLQQVSTVAGGGGYGHRDGAAAQAQFSHQGGLVLLPDSRVLVADWGNHCIRVLSADLQQVSTLTNADGLNPRCLEQLPDGRLLVGDNNRIHVLKGFPATLLGTKPSHKPPKTKNQKKKKRALAGGASSPGLVLKRSRSGASSSAAAAAAATAVSSSDSEGEEQPGGSAVGAEPEPLV